MITKLTLRNFKGIKEQSYLLTNFDLLVGSNNCGKSTVLQAMAIWQYCIEEFRRAKRTGDRGIQIVLPNFTALPVPEFNLLWNERTDREYPKEKGKKKQVYILIEINIEWKDSEGKTFSFEVNLRYHSPLAIYAIPKGGWEEFNKRESAGLLPTMAFVPPFSGLEPEEQWVDEGPLRKQVGKAQPGSILRNLLLRVWENNKEDWREIQRLVKKWFSVELREPKYEHGIDTLIACEYKQSKKSYDIISGGSGFHQTLTLLAFLYGYHPMTILLDEPDAHLHVNLQREILDYFKRKSAERGTQFLIATHAEELVKGVDANQIVSLISGKPKRAEQKNAIMAAMADVLNAELTQLQTLPLILYVEGESDERILRAWAPICNAGDFIYKICFKPMGGGDKQGMKEEAARHFGGIKQAIPDAKRLMLFDPNSSSLNPNADNPVLCEWKRKNIENYLLVPDAWIRATLRKKNIPDGGLFAPPIRNTINEFFASENLTLPKNQSWQNVSAKVFSYVDGKKMLFEDDNSLFYCLRNEHKVDVLREEVANAMKEDEIHQDVHDFFSKLRDTYNGLTETKKLLE